MTLENICTAFFLVLFDSGEEFSCFFGIFTPDFAVDDACTSCTTVAEFSNLTIYNQVLLQYTIYILHLIKKT